MHGSFGTRDGERKNTGFHLKNFKEREQRMPGTHLRNNDIEMDIEVNSWEGLEWISVP
jgi:hypothetical protein